MYRDRVREIIADELRIYSYYASDACIESMADKITYALVGVEVD